jgi:hypothetical protein
MIRNILILAVCILSSGALAGPSTSPRFEGQAGLIPDKKFETFFTRKVDQSWTVYGINYLIDGTVYPAGPICALENRYGDGSLLQISVAIRTDRKPPTFKIYFKDNTWEISGPYPQVASLQLNMFKEGKFVDGGELKFMIMSKNGIVISGIAGKFGASFEKSDKLVFVMPGTIKNSTVQIPGRALLYFDDCHRAYANLPEENDMAEPANRESK